MASHCLVALSGWSDKREGRGQRAPLRDPRPQESKPGGEEEEEMASGLHLRAPLDHGSFGHSPGQASASS